MIRLNVHGHPQPQGSKTAYVNKHTGRAVVAEGKGEGRIRHKEWRRAVADTARAHLDREGELLPAKGPLAVTIIFRMPKPPSRPKREHYVTVKPDTDKLIRSVFDGLADGGLLVGGDQRISVVQATKRYVEDGEAPGALVTIHAVSL